MRSTRWWIAVAAILLIPADGLAQERGAVTGRVIDAATQQPLVQVQVSVGGTTLGTLTDQQGRFLITNVPAGSREIRTTLIGYSQGTQVVTVPAGGTATADFDLRISALALEGIIVTATGETQRVRERGNVVSQIAVADMNLAPINTMSQVLQGRSAGVVVQQSGGTSGTGSRVRIRGSASASLGNQPLVIVDGVRVNESPESFSIGVGGQSTSRLEDINPDEIESIEILKGPAAAALYGTAAATGVIQITTKRGRAGPARWNAYTELGLLHERNEWFGNYRQLGTTPAGARVHCTTFRQAAGQCTPTEMLSWNPLMDREQGHGVSNPELGPASPFRDGNRQKFGVNVAGGVDRFTYFFSTERDEEQGIFRNNELARTSLRANVRGQIRDDLELTVTSGWISSDIRLPWNDNTEGPVGNAITGEPEDDPEFRGYGGAPPSMLARIDTRQGLGRLVGSANTNYRPIHWLQFVGTAGLDVLNRRDTQTVPPETVFSGSLPEGVRTSNRIEIGNYTATFGATATAPIGADLVSTTSAGAQYHREIFRGTYATGWQLLAGTSSLAGTNARPAVNEVHSDVINVGVYGQQQFGWRDRVFVTAALRGDDNSAFGTDFGLIWYPALSASWVMSEEPWFPDLGVLESFRLRAAVGRSGLRPGFRQAITHFTPVAATVEGRDYPGFTIGGVGDPELAPEISTEVEGGFDLGLFDGRLGLEFTAYNKRSEDALIARRLAPSLGLSLTRFENIGVTRNHGVEFAANASILTGPTARWNAQVSFGTNHNELVEMEGDPIIFGLAGGQRHSVGYPLGGYWSTPYTFSDPNGDGLLRIQDVVMGDEDEYVGTPFPTRNASFSTDLTLWNIVRIGGMLEHQGGHTLWSGSHEWQCVFLLCQDINDPTASLEAQARAIATYWNFSWYGYLEDASFTKLRELSLTFMAPQGLLSRMRGIGGASLTLAGRNLATWTNYTGIDPEVNFAGQDNFSTADFQSQPPIRHWTARINVTF
jgi:TonB-dependent starch-binding outer membrane protein SusC